jgi:hypothetical protein
MKKLTRLLAAAAVVGLVTVTVKDALAGNLAGQINPGQGWGGQVASWFSVVMTPTQVLSFNAQASGGRYMLIDDVTYSVDVRPYQSVTPPATNGFGARVAAFSFGDLYGVEELYGSNIVPMPGPPPMPSFLSYLSGSLFGVIQWDAEVWSNAKGDWFALELQNWFPPAVYPPNGMAYPFDRVSHTANIQMAGREVWFNDYQQQTGLGLGMSISQSISNKSESRHYHTPVMCLPSSQVRCVVPAGASSYTNARIYIKGRIVNTSLPIPVVNYDVTVQ